MNALTLLLAIALAAPASAQQPAKRELARWQREARRVEIVRDDWGIAHVRGRSDADAVFGLVYAQAEDDFNRVETNYLTALGRSAEAAGESAIYSDLRQRLFIDPVDLKAQYARAPAWLKELMSAWADGLNYYLYSHPRVRPRAITRFEPWMALSFTEGSIGGDIERIDLEHLQAFYGPRPETPPAAAEANSLRDPGGSNGFAIAPANTTGHHALLLINPHTSFFFRAEAQVASDEGLNAYGAVTWGQFFVYQGFNERLGWMHTSSGVDAIDEYRETIVKKGDRYFYRYGGEERPVTTAQLTVPYRTGAGVAHRVFTVYRTHHGPIVRELDGAWVSVRLMQEPIKALMQSYSRTKARDLKAFRQVMELHANSSNNTIYADADGNIAYFHANFIPRRDPRFDWSQPVDGSDPATEWRGLLTTAESPHVVNPAVGWLYNSNDSPWWAAGPDSPKQSEYPAYVDRAGSSWRGRHAVMVLQSRKDFDLGSLIAAAYDSFLPAFAELLPPLLAAYDELGASDPLKDSLAEQITLLRGWDYRWSAGSTPTSLAVFWAKGLGRRLGTASPEEQLRALAAASEKLTADFGTWRTPWGEINRFQRLSGDIEQRFEDDGPSIPVAFLSGRLGSLASFSARAYANTRKWYGTSGNSFVAAVEFGDTVRARAVTAGGESGDPASPHFNDQAQRYASGDLRPVYFYRSELAGHVERSYHPGL